MVRVQFLKKLYPSLRGAIIFIAGRRSNLFLDGRPAGRQASLMLRLRLAVARNDESRRASYNRTVTNKEDFSMTQYNKKKIGILLMSSLIIIVFLSHKYWSRNTTAGSDRIIANVEGCEITVDDFKEAARASLSNK